MNKERTEKGVDFMSIVKRTVSTLLICAMLLGMVPVYAGAEETGTSTVEYSVPEAAVEPVSTEAGTNEAASDEELPEGTSIPVETRGESEPADVTEATTASQEAAAVESASVFDSTDLVKLEIQTLPDRTKYQVGDEIDLTGIVLYAEDSQGLSQTVGAEEVSILSGDTSASGRYMVTVSYGNLTASYEIMVHTLYFVGEILQDSADYPESNHNYANNIDISYPYSCENAEYLKLTFSSSTRVESNYDKIYIYDGNDTLVGTYTGTALSGATITVPGDTVRIRLTSDGSYTYYGFSLTSIYAYMNLVTHENADEGIYTEPKCFEDAYTTHTCRICGESFIEQHPDTAAHAFIDGFCRICGLPEETVSSGIISDTIVWAITENNTLYISGIGEFPDNFTWDEDTSAATALVVGEGITRLGRNAFYGRSALQTVSLPESLSSIGDNAFYGCSDLSSIDLPDTLESIGSNAFRGCTGLTSIYIPANVSSITAASYSASPFYSCSSGMVIYCAADEKQSGWDNYWNYYASSGVLSTNYGYSAQEYAYWTSFDNTAETIVIQDGITVIPSKAFYNCTALISVTLPEGLTAIGEYAFHGCSALTEIVIPDSVTSIGRYAFANCSGLTGLTLPASLTKLGIRFLSGTSGVTEIAIPAGLTECGYESNNGILSGSSVITVTFAEGTAVIPDYALYGGSYVTSVTMPDSVTSVGSYAFYQCTRLASVNLSSALTSIGNYAFNACSELTALTIPDSVTTIGDYAFYNCSKMALTALPAGLTEIGSYAFYQCNVLTAKSFPENLTSIGDYAFSGCTGLTEAAFSDKLVSIGNYAFNGCSALASVTLPEGLTALGYSVFYGCSALTELRLPGTITTMSNNSDRGPLDGSGITKITFGDGFTLIPAYALSCYSSSGTYGSKITEVLFEAPEKITSIGPNAFYNCAALESIAIPEGITTIPSYSFNGCKSLTSVTLPQNLTTIGSNAFSGCTALSSVTLPEGLTTLGYSVFYGCTALTELRLPASITTMSHNGYHGSLDGSGITKVIFGDGFTTIPAYALSNYSSGTTSTDSSRIREVVFEAPEKITSIGSYAFRNCAALESIAVPDAVTALPNYVFYGCQSLTTVTMPESLTSIGSYAFNGCTALTSVVIPETVKTIDTYAFYNCTALSEIDIPAGASVNGYAFMYCTSLTSATIGDNATIKNYAFNNCTGLRSIVLGENVTLEPNAFNNVVISGTCGDAMTWTLNLGNGTLTLDGSGEMTDYSPEAPAPWNGFASMIQAIEYGSSVTDIGAYAFTGCSALKGLILPDTIKTISENSFFNCENICYVEIPDSVQYIGENAFADCGALEDAVFLGDAPVMEDNCFGASPVDVHYPETASGFITRIFEKFVQYVWRKWDDTVPSKDVVILLDTSGSMSGREGTLSSASTQLIKSIGGATKKTSIAVVTYASSARTLANFTTNTYQLADSVSNLSANGGTNYSNALNRANSLLSGRSSDIKFVVMFSDGSPGDSTSTINSLAASMREQGIVIYTVGLLSSSTQRQVLINVAGDESRYFEASNIAGLIAAFEELSKNFGKSEYSTAEIKINDVRHDLLNEAYSLCLASDTLVSFYLTPGINEMYRDVASIALEQDGRYVLRNDTGVFENIRPGDYFQSGNPVYIVMLDAQGNVIERKQLLLNFTDSFKVTYVLGPDMNNEIYLEEDFIPGNDITEPAEPTREGYKFMGWYASENCEGTEFFSILNSSNRRNLENNIILYAKWQEDFSHIIMGIDNWTFYNTSSAFGYPANYEISIRDYNQLVSGLKNSKKSKIDDEKDSEWGGSCFGMSSSVVLAKQDIIDINDFDSGYTYVGQARLIDRADGSVGNVESMINFYHLRQFLGNILNIRTSYNPLWDSGNLKKIVQKMEDADEPIVMTIKFDSFSGGHAVVAFDLEETDDGYTFQVYDCSQSVNRAFPVDVTVGAFGGYSASCPAWETEWSSGIFFKAGLTSDELAEMAILTAPGTVGSNSDTGTYNNVYAITTSYSDFTISNGTNSAVVENGQVTSGDLEITCYGAINEVGYAEEYLFEVPVLSNGAVYTIRQSVPGKSKTTVEYDHPSSGFYGSVTANASGVIIVESDGTVRTQYSGETEQSILMSHNSMTTPWYSVKVSGTTAGLDITVAGAETHITSDTEKEVTVEVKSDFNRTTLTDIPAGQTETTISEGEDRTCVAIRDGEVISDASFGYSVAFDSQMGTSVETLLNVPYGSLIEEPTDPTRVGYIFQGWFKDAEHTEIWDFDTDTVTEDTILYAGWSINPNYLQSVTFQVPGAEPQIVYIPKGDRIPANYAPFGQDGEALIWYTNATYTSKAWDFDTDTVTGDIILYGKTTLCTISYVTNCDQALADSKIYTGMVIPEPAGLVKEGYTLCGWYTDEAFVNEWNFVNDTVTENVTLYAKWLRNEFDKNGEDTGICIEILQEDSYVYTGKAIKPEIIVRDDGNVLTAGVDYTVSYKNNTNAQNKENSAVNASKLPQVVVQGKGNYKSAKMITKSFTIHQADMKELRVTLPAYVAAQSGNKLQSVKATVSTDLIKVAASNYTIHYYTDAELTQSVKGITAPGLYYVTVEAKLDKEGGYSGNFKGVSDAFVIEVAPASLMLTSAKITLPATINAVSEHPDENDAIQALISKIVLNKVTYLTNDDAIETFKELFVVTARDSDGTEVSQSDLGVILLSVGQKAVTVSAREGNSMGFVGEKTVTVNVKGTSLSKKQFQVTFDKTGQATVLKSQYSGVSQVPVVLSALNAGTDYTVSYKSGRTSLSAWQVKNAGTYSLIISGKGSYSGTLTYSFSITQVDVAKAYAAGNIRITSPGEAIYSPDGAKLSLTVSYINEWGTRVAMTEGRDYTLSYSGNNTVTEKAAITLKGMGNFSGSLNKNKAPELIYTVTKKPLSASDISVTVTGVTVKADKITDVKYTVYHAGKKVAASQYTHELMDDSDDTVTLKITGKSILYTGSRSLEIRKNITKTTDAKKVKISLPKENRYYTGSSIRPQPIITDAEGNDISDCFTITYGTNIKVGSGSVTITGRPDMGYYGEKTLTFIILPKWTQWIFG